MPKRNNNIGAASKPGGQNVILQKKRGRQSERGVQSKDRPEKREEKLEARKERSSVGRERKGTYKY